VLTVIIEVGIAIGQTFNANISTSRDEKEFFNF